MIALDLFCGGGGAARGIVEAGFKVVGIDTVDHSQSYPGLFIQGDALNPPVKLDDFDFIWASPPCQAFSAATTKNRDRHPDLIEPTRNLIKDHPWTVIENVPGAPIRANLVLTGACVGLPSLLRKRIFELSFFCLYPQHLRPKELVVTVTKSRGVNRNKSYLRRSMGLPPNPTKKDCAEAMGLPLSMSMNEIGEAVPPAYAYLIAKSALRAMGCS